MDPWSNEYYSRFIREASVVVENPPEVVPPSGKVPGRGLLVLPILEARRRRNRGEIAKKGSVLGGFWTREIYRQSGAARGPPEVQAASRRGPALGRAPGRVGTRWGPSGPPFGRLEAS